jgi:ATP-dependent Clp protease ATP-binding subunit ClpX
MPKYGTASGLSCSFCHKAQREVDKIIAGPNVYICSDCIRLCLDIIRESQARPPNWAHTGVQSPARIKAFLDQYAVGQDAAKRTIAVAVYNHYKRIEANTTPGDVELQKSNVLLIGPTGTGKTLLCSSLARLLDVPFVITDATTLTEAGYVGEDVENIILHLYQAANGNLEKTQRGIVYIDEVDKLARKSFSASVARDVSGEGVQQALLKIVEGTQCTIHLRGNKKVGNAAESVVVDTRNILFLCGGSFEGLDKIIETRIGRRSVGFQREEPDPDARVAARKNALKRLTTEDLEKFGLIPEFIGRLPVVATLDPLGVDDLVHVLTEPKNALIKQYQRLLRFEKVRLRFSEGAIRAVAERALARKSGARGLRAILESVMLDVMFDAPSVAGLEEVVVTEGAVRGDSQPEYVTSEPLPVPG